MFKLPVCPHCHKRYRYWEIVRMSQNDEVCHYCGKKFKPEKKKGMILLLSIVCPILIVLNILIMLGTESFLLLNTALIDGVMIAMTMMLSPFLVRLVPSGRIKTKDTKSGKDKASRR